MSTTQPDAFLLLTLHNATIRTPTATHTGVLNLQCVTVARPDSSPTPIDREVFLVLNITPFETPIDPCRVIHTSRDGSGNRTYTFDGTDIDPSDLVLTIAPPPVGAASFEEDIGAFESILAQYADFRRAVSASNNASSSSGPVPSTSSGSGLGSIVTTGVPSDLRGQLILVNEASGELVGGIDKKFRIHEDPMLYERGHENDPVLIEIPEGKEIDALEVFARAVPREQHDWITQSATVISHAISSTTNVLLTSITSVASHYISKSRPSSPGPAGTPPALPPRALAFLTSATTRKGLTGVHALSQTAVHVSSATVSLINRMINRAVGGKPKGDRRSAYYNHTNTLSPTVAPRSPSPAPGSPPPYSPRSSRKPDLPPRRTSSPSSPAKTATTTTGAPQPPPLPPRTLSTKDKLILSADLILSTLDQSAKQLLNVSGERLGAVVGHKYGSVAGQNTVLATDTMRNAVLVYIDMRGIGRKALLRTAGKEFIKARAT